MPSNQPPTKPEVDRPQLICFSRIGVFLYRPRYTLSLTWMNRWKWLPEVYDDGLSWWSFWWGSFEVMKRKWRSGDPYGAEAGEIDQAIFDYAVNSFSVDQEELG